MVFLDLLLVFAVLFVVGALLQLFLVDGDQLNPVAGKSLVRHNFLREDHGLLLRLLNLEQVIVFLNEFVCAERLEPKVCEIIFGFVVFSLLFCPCELNFLLLSRLLVLG